MIKPLLLILSCCLTILCDAQTLSSSLLGSSGGNETISNLHLSWTFGEDFINYNHNQEFPNYLQSALEEHRIGIKDDHWVVCQDFNPFSYCSSAAQTICIVEVEPFGL
jgi:hypothetical protein